MVEHMATGEEQHGDQTEGGPEIAVLEDRNEVGGSNGKEGNATKYGSGDGDDLHIVDGTADTRLGGIGGEMAGDP
jgi:hypothetical protein